MQNVDVAGAAEAGGELRLSPSQWLELDVYGFTVIEGLYTSEDLVAMRSALLRLRDEADLDALGVYVNRRNDHMFHVGHVLEYDHALFRYATDPRLVGLARQLVGGNVRLEETEAIINRRDESEPACADGHVEATGFHTGTRHGWGTYTLDNHFRCLFVKTLIYLTDVGPGDGGTAVVPGSHRLDWREKDIIAAAVNGNGLVHQVQASAGSVLLFPEALVHSTTKITTESERVVLISGYTPPFMREWPGNGLSGQFIARLDPKSSSLLTGGASWNWRPDSDGGEGDL